MRWNAGRQQHLDEIDKRLVDRFRTRVNSPTSPRDITHTAAIGFGRLVAEWQGWPHAKVST